MVGAVECRAGICKACTQIHVAPITKRLRHLSGQYCALLSFISTQMFSNICVTWTHTSDRYWPAMPPLAFQGSDEKYW